MVELDVEDQHTGFKVLMGQHSAEYDTLSGETGKIADNILKIGVKFNLNLINMMSTFSYISEMM